MRERAITRGRIGQVLSVALVAVGLVAAPAVQREGTPPQPAVRATSLVPVLQFSAATVGDASPWSTFEAVPSESTVMVAADWGGRDDVEVQVRAKDESGWTEWFGLVYEPDHAPDVEDLPEGKNPSTASDPLWLGQTDLIEVRARGAQVPVELVRVDLAGGDGLGWTPPELRNGSVARAASEQPEILSRASWGANESIRRYTPREWNRANFAIVHHTAGRNDYAQDEVDDILRSVYAYHVQTKGWDDIAYNFLVDRFGTVWEGRYGGITRPVVGGHAAGFNGGSIGISAIGNYQTAEPSPEMVAAIRGLLGWKLDLHHIDPHGETEEIAGGGSSNRYAAGTHVTLPTITGHRLTNSTTCPGDKLYEYVMGLNGDVAFADQLDEVGHPKAYGGPPQEREQPLDGTRPAWDITFTRPVTWQLSIVDEAGGVVRTGSGQSDGELSIAWDMRDGSGALVAPGKYFAQLDAVDLEGTPITPVTTVFDVTPPAERRSGPTRMATAAALSSWSFTQNERVVIASAEAFPDALVAGPLAGSLDAPILLVPAAGVPTEVADEIQRLHASKAYIVGGKGRVTADVEAGLRAAGITSITRLSGADRYETSAAVARFLIARDHPTEALLAVGSHPVEARAFPDALSAGAFGASQIAPVLLVSSTVLPGAVGGVLGQRPWADGLLVFGGASAISPEVAQAAREAAGVYEGKDSEDVPMHRFAGKNRYDTSALAAEELLTRAAEKIEKDGPSPYVEPTGLEVVLASGVNWPDALGASAAAAKRGAVFVLVAPDRLDSSPDTAAWLQSHARELSHAIVSGGTGAIAEEVVASIAAIVASAGPSTDSPEAWPSSGQPSGILPFPLPLFPTEEPEPEPSPSPSSTDPTPQPSGQPSEGTTSEPTEEPTDGT